MQSGKLEKEFWVKRKMEAAPSVELILWEGGVGETIREIEGGEARRSLKG